MRELVRILDMGAAIETISGMNETWAALNETAQVREIEADQVLISTTTGRAYFFKEA